GEHVWSQVLGGATDQRVEALALTPGGDILVAGTFTTEIFIDGVRHPETVDALAEDAFIACLAGDDGHRKWSKTFGGASAQRARAISVDPDGDVFLAGDFVEGIDIEGTWVPGFGPGTGSSDVFVIHLTSDGQYADHV